MRVLGQTDTYGSPEYMMLRNVKIAHIAAGARRRVRVDARLPPPAGARAAGKRTRGLAAAEAGFTLIELLVASAIAITVFAGTMVLLESSTQVQSRDAEWVLTMQQNRAGLARMIQEIRQATKVEEAKAGAIEFLARIGGKSLIIKYDCSVAETGTTFDECVRRAASEGESLPTAGTQVATAILNGSSVFSYTPSSTAATVATVKLEVPAEGTLKQTGGAYTHKVVLENGAFMRNLYLAG